MSAGEWTAGPWRTQGWVPTWAYIPVKDARHNLVASLYPDAAHNYTRDQVEANANLIAAAPELYEALKAAEEELRLLRMKDTAVVYNPMLRTQIAMALTKASGEPM